MYCNINNIICLRLLPPQAPPTMIQERVKDCSNSSDVSALRFIHQARHCISESSSGGGSASSPPWQCSYWLLQFGGGVLIWAMTPIPIILSPEDNDIKDSSLGPSSSLQFSSFARNHGAWTLPAGIVPAGAGWASSNLLPEGLSSRSINSFSFTSTQKNVLWWNSVLLR